MTTKETLLAADLLDMAADAYTNNGCNDWEYPPDWTLDDKITFAREYHEHNGTPLEFNAKQLHLPDFAVMRFMADQLRREISQ